MVPLDSRTRAGRRELGQCLVNLLQHRYSACHQASFDWSAGVFRIAVMDLRPALLSANRTPVGLRTIVRLRTILIPVTDCGPASVAAVRNGSIRSMKQMASSICRNSERSSSIILPARFMGYSLQQTSDGQSDTYATAFRSSGLFQVDDKLPAGQMELGRCLGKPGLSAAIAKLQPCVGCYERIWSNAPAGRRS
jgi:hypothetical protein